MRRDFAMREGIECDTSGVSVEDAIAFLDEYEEWRLGKGKYAWSECPSANKPFPYSPADATRHLRAARNFLSELVKA